MNIAIIDRTIFGKTLQLALEAGKHNNVYVYDNARNEAFLAHANGFDMVIVHLDALPIIDTFRVMKTFTKSNIMCDIIFITKYTQKPHMTEMCAYVGHSKLLSMYTDDNDYECLFDVIEQYTASHQPPLKMSRVAAQVTIRSGMQKLLQMNDKEISILADLSRNVSVNKTMKKYKIGSDKVHEILSTFESFIGSPIRKYRHLFHILS